MVTDADPSDYSADYYSRRPRHPLWQVEARLIRDFVGPARGTVVDLGCGSGDLLAALAPTRGVGIDYNQTAIDLARAHLPDYDFRVGDASRPDLPPASADAVVSMHLIEHLADPGEAMRAWRTILRPGGRLAMATPNGAFSHPEEFDDSDHKHIFTGPELAETAEAAGFRVRRVLTAGLWGLRRWPLLWRLQPLLFRVRVPAFPGLRWRGQTLCLAAVKGESS